MKIVIDIETNSLVNPTSIWLIGCKDIDTGDYYIFREPTSNSIEKDNFLAFCKNVELWIGHGILSFDIPILQSLVNFPEKDCDRFLDTLILSRLIDYTRPDGHSVEAYGKEFGLEKIEFNDFKKYSKELEDYCIRDVDITHKVYLKYLKYLSNPLHKDSITLEHKFQYIMVNNLSNNGFRFNISRAKELLKDVQDELDILDRNLKEAFPPKLKLIREISPKETKHGTLSKTDFRWLADQDGAIDLSDYNGGPFCRCHWVEFNPASPKQVIDVLNAAGWKPSDKTDTHIETERNIRRDPSLKEKLKKFRVYGWKINETNLETLPSSAPAPARTLAKRIVYESRRRTLTEWLSLVQEDGRIHGKFLGLGAWTHRMASQKPNMQNIPNEFFENGSIKFLGKELRQLWRADAKRLLVGVDAEGIQLRVFAHYINDPELTNALVNGSKSKKTDPHSVNKRILGSVCRSRQAAKRFLYALFLGGGLAKLAEILECNEQEAKEALNRLMEQYRGWAAFKDETIRKDAKNGFFIGLDGRKVAFPHGKTESERRHLAMSGYLQNGEAVIMKKASLIWYDELKEKGIWFKPVNMVHDEWQTETKNNMEEALLVAEAQVRALREVGKILNLRCPLEGSYWNEDHRDYTIGTNWYQTH